MTKDPNQKSTTIKENKENKEYKEHETERFSHEEVLDVISKKVDEKLYQISSTAYDEDMERQLAEIHELRRLEKEALEQTREARRKKRRKGRSRGTASDKKKPSIYSQSTEMKGEESFQGQGQADKKAENKRHVSIVEMAAEAIAEADAEKKRLVAAQEEAASAFVQKAEAEAAEAGRQKARIKAQKSGGSEEDVRVAQAVDRFFDTAEEIAAEAEREEPFFAKLSAWLKGMGTSVKKKQKNGEKPSNQTVAESQPSRKLDRSIDGLLGGPKLFLKKAALIGKDLYAARSDMAGETHLTHEKRMARYRAVWARHCNPVIGTIEVFSHWSLLKRAQLTAWRTEKKENFAVRVSLFAARSRVRLGKAYLRILRAVDYGERHKMKMFRWFAGAVVCAGIVSIMIGSLTAYEYIYNGKVLGLVKDQEMVYKTIDVIGEKLAQSLNADIEMDKRTDISFRKVVGLGLSIDSKDDVLNSLTYMKTLKAKGYAIVVDGKRVAIMQGEQGARLLLQTFKERFAQQKEGVEYKDVGFAQDVKVEEINTELGNIQNTDEAMQYLLTGAVEKKVHGVTKGQTFNAIAKSYGLTPAQLEASNPGIDPNKLKIDQKLVLTQDAPVLTVQTKEVATYTADIPYDIVYEDTTNKYKGEKSVKLKGANGKRTVVAEIVRNNGVEVSRKELSSTVVSQPVNQVVLVGTKEKPKTVASGSFAYPVRGARLSSRYGARWGRKHLGIDLAISKGTPITAADGGTVTFAGYKDSYGYLVIIDHGNGKETYYAHCSKLLVSRGAKVYKGQTIAKVGSTGNSTGSHLHFEVHVNGVPKNPLSYL